jgi:predicted amidohydrolase
MGGFRRSARVACVQYGQSALDSYGAFEDRVARFVSIAASYGTDFVVFPEMFTLQLLTIAHRDAPMSQAVAALDTYTARVKATFAELAKRHKLYVVGGSHFLRDEAGTARNVCFTATPDGTLHAQAKIHATPSERDAWGIVGGDAAAPFATDFGPVAATICYDVEFPELQAHLAAGGARIVFVPFCTDDRRGYMRVRLCAQARAIENQCYLALAGNVGVLPHVANMDVQYAESCLLTPCDVPFARDGVAEIAPAGVETFVFADFDLDALDAARKAGTVRNLADRRNDLYRVEWRGR